jgi:hypothetical protein
MGGQPTDYCHESANGSLDARPLSLAEMVAHGLFGDRLRRPRFTDGDIGDSLIRIQFHRLADHRPRLSLRPALNNEIDRLRDRPDCYLREGLCGLRYETTHSTVMLHLFDCSTRPSKRSAIAFVQIVVLDVVDSVDGKYDSGVNTVGAKIGEHLDQDGERNRWSVGVELPSIPAAYGKVAGKFVTDNALNSAECTF